MLDLFRFSRLLSLVTVLLFVLTAPGLAQQPVDADVLFSNARIFDGVLEEPYTGDIAIKGDRIVAIAKRPETIEAGRIGWKIDLSLIHI